MRQLLMVLLLALSFVVHAEIESLTFETAEQEQRYKYFIDELRCLVCQNQNLADSNADLAKDLRMQTYEMITGGKSDQEIIDYMVNRYGDFVLYRPPLKTNTLLLWGGPFIILFLATVIFLRMLRQRNRQAVVHLGESDKAKARGLLAGNEGEKES